MTKNLRYLKKTKIDFFLFLLYFRRLNNCLNQHILNMFSTRGTKSRDSKSVNDGGEFTGTLAKAPNGSEFSYRRYQSQLLKQARESGNTWAFTTFCGHLVPL